MKNNELPAYRPYTSDNTTFIWRQVEHRKITPLTETDWRRFLLIASSCPRAALITKDTSLQRNTLRIEWPLLGSIAKGIFSSGFQNTTPATQKSLMPYEVPSRPWEQIAVDLFELRKKKFMVALDYCSNFWKVDRLTSTTSAAVILKLKNHFARYGCPDHLISAENGPQPVHLIRVRQVC